MFLGLFLKPALIVTGLVGVLVLFSWAGKFLGGRGWGSGRSPEQFLQGLDDPNKAVRWQVASDLAQVLHRDDRLASDPDFALALAARLDAVRTDNAASEKRFATLGTALGEREREALETQRSYILYLGACLANFMLPVGTSQLEALALQEKGLEPLALSQRRRHAVWALANLGENLKRFDRLPPEQQAAVLQRLDAAAQGAQGTLARQSAEYLRRRQEGHADALGMDRVLQTCAGSDDPALRELTAFAANFWTGTATEDARIEKTLLGLAGDDGHGEDELDRLLEGNPGESSAMARFLGDKPDGPRALARPPGFRVRANATVALARRGSPRVDVAVLQQMLDPDLLRQRFVLQDRKTRQESPDEALVANTLVTALKAIAELHRKRPEMKLSGLRPRIDHLAEDANPDVQTEARQTRQALENAS
jgi:hypothetical protein